MPIYEYECEGGHRSEAFKPMSESGNSNQCPQCGRLAGRIISRLASGNFFNLRMPFTVFNSDGNVIEKRYDLKPTPHPEQYYDVKRIREDQMADAYAEAKKE